MTAATEAEQWHHRDGSPCAHRFVCWRGASPPPGWYPDPVALADAMAERVDARLAEHGRWLDGALGGLRRDSGFMGYCIADLADSMRIHRDWPVADGRCQHDGCGMLITGTTEAHVRACHWDAFQAMRKPFSPPGWHEASPGQWVPDAEGAQS